MSDASLERKRPRVGAFFDMDKTLIAENSGSLYMRRRYERGEINGMELLRGIGAYVQYKLGVLDLLNWTRKMMVQFEGRSEADLERETAEWFEELVAPAVYPEAERLVIAHREAGDIVAIVSGATRFVVEPLARQLGIEHMLYTRLEVEDGRFTGRIVEPICFEEGKIFWIRKFIEEHEIDLAKSYFYTDSVTDTPLLDLVGHPVVVNPDPMLYLRALRRRWPVRFFESPRR